MADDKEDESAGGAALGFPIDGAAIRRGKKLASSLIPSQSVAITRRESISQEKKLYNELVEVFSKVGDSTNLSTNNEFKLTLNADIEKRKEVLLQSIRSKVADLRSAIASGDFVKIRTLKEELSLLSNEAAELGVSIQEVKDAISAAKDVESQDRLNVSDVYVGVDRNWLGEFDKSVLELSEEIDEFITPEITNQLDEYNKRLDSKKDLTEEEAKGFVDLHLNGDRWDKHKDLVSKTSKEIKEYSSRREALVQAHGEDHESVKNFDSRTGETAEVLRNKHTKLKEHTKRLHKIVSRSEAVERAQEKYTIKEEIEKMATQLEVSGEFFGRVSVARSERKEKAVVVDRSKDDIQDIQPRTGRVTEGSEKIVAPTSKAETVESQPKAFVKVARRKRLERAKESSLPRAVNREGLITDKPEYSHEEDKLKDIERRTKRIEVAFGATDSASLGAKAETVESQPKAFVKVARRRRPGRSR